MNLKDIMWNKKTYKEYVNYLSSLKDDKYREFNSKIVSSKYIMLGIRIPILRKIAKEIFKGDYTTFLSFDKPIYFEEVMIKGFVIAQIKDLEEFISYFLLYIYDIDNWAICDSFCNSLKLVNDNKKYFLEVINKLVGDKYQYAVRVGLIILLNYYVEEEYLKIIFEIIDKTESDFYYVNMARAWLLCEVFTKYPDYTLDYLEKNTLDKFTINKTISKIRDSYRVSENLKKYVLKYKK